MNLIKLSSDLIKFKSVTPNSAGSLEFIEKILKENKFKCHLLEFGNKKIKNLYAEIKGGKGPNLCFAGHTDVVPVSKGWSTDPFNAEIKNDKLYGRGSCDMKGFIACTLAYAPIYSKSNLDRDINFCFTFDEETACQGAPILIEELKKKRN